MLGILVLWLLCLNVFLAIADQWLLPCD